MRGLTRALIVAASVALGSWVGLHPRLQHALGPQATIAITSPSGSGSGSGQETKTGAAPPGLALAPHLDPADVPGRSPWPRLNVEASITNAWRLAEGPHREPSDKRRLVTLTFDDGPFPETTPRVLELLAKYDVHATFFVIGRYLDGESARARASRDVLRDVVAAGHLVGNHTHDHTLLTAISHTQVLEQIDRGAASIERAIGKRPILFRPPFGELDEFGQEAARARQLDVFLWSIEAQDMARDDTHAMYRELVQQLRYNEGGVVLLHDVRWTSVKILSKLLGYLDARRYDPAHPEREGYEIVDLPSYLRAVEASPPQPGVRPRGVKRPKLPVAASTEPPSET